MTMLFWTAVRSPEEDLQPILRDGVEIVVASLKKEKFAGDNAGSVTGPGEQENGLLIDSVADYYTP